MRKAIDFYHDLLLRPEYLQSTREILEAETETLSVAGRPSCNVLRPCFVEESTYEYIKKASELVMRAISTLGGHLKTEQTIRRKLDLTAEEEAIVRIDTGYGAPDVSARLDGFLAADGTFHFVEYNADSPGGLGYGDALSDVFRKMPILQAFSQRYNLRAFPIRSLVFDKILNAYRRWGGRNLPNVAIIDWQDAVTYNEFLLFQQQFEEGGCKVRIGAPEDLEYKNGRLLMGDFAVDVIYKRVIVGELLRKFGLKHPMIDAVRDHSVCMINGFGVQTLFKKILFSILSDPVYGSLFDSEVADALARHIPWTRKLRESKTVYRDSEIDLLPFVMRNRERLVLKPNGEYGGKGVLLGWECSNVQWEAAISEALRSSYVIQERVELGSEKYPSVINNQLQFDERFFDLDPYVWDGQTIDGCGVRLSRLAILNVSAGGGSATPLFVIT